MLLGTFETASASHEVRRRESIDLRRIHLLSALEEEALALIQTQGSVRAHPRGVTLAHAGEDIPAVHALLSGRVKVFLANEDGKEIVLGALEAGDCFGEIALLDDAVMNASIATLEPTRILVIPRHALAEIARVDAQFAVQLAQRFAQQVQQLSDQVKSLGLCNVYQRLARVLSGMAVTHANGHGAELVINQRFTHQELAKRIGASREMVTRIFRDLVIGGYLRMEGKRVVIAKKLPASW